MKKVYVVNLDNKRIWILTGVILTLVAGAFFAGNMNSRPSYSTNDDFNRILGSGGEKPSEEHEPFSNSPEAYKDGYNNEDKTPDHANNFTEAMNDPFLEGKNQDGPKAAPDKSSQAGLSVKNDPFLKAPKQTGAKSVSDKNSDKTKYYTIQLGAYKHEKDAKRFVEELNRKGVDARVDRGVMFYFVRAGKTTDKDALEPLFKKIHDRLKLEAIVVYRTIS